MTEPAIQVEQISKKYRLGQHAPYQRLSEVVSSLATSPLKLLRKSTAAQSQAASPKAAEHWALRDVTFDIKPGEVVGVIGRNGAGKSTLLKLISRITEPTAGRAKIRGRIGSLLEVGTGFHPELTGRENIFLNGAILGMSRAEIRRKFDEIVEFAQFAPFLDTPVKRYSSGMYMRLAFSVAAHLEPEILLVDEVLAVGDAEFQQKCLGKMNSVARTGRTILFVSHNMNAIEHLCNRVILLEQGQLKQDDRDVRSVIQTYMQHAASQFTSWKPAEKPFENDWFRLNRFYLADGNGEVLQHAQTNDQPVDVHIDVEIFKTHSALNFGFEIQDERGHVVFWSLNTDTPQSPAYRVSTGLQHLVARIPAHYLNEGRYQVQLIASLHCIEWLAQPGVNAPTVSLQVEGKLSDSPYWIHRRPGMMAPVFEWSRAA